jgi:hypothetical protein
VLGRKPARHVEARKRCPITKPLFPKGKRGLNPKRIVSGTRLATLKVSQQMCV